MGKLKGYLFQKTKLWEELVVLTPKVKKPRSQKKKQEVIKKNGILCFEKNNKKKNISFSSNLCGITGVVWNP